jgi:hypothetical protein
MAFKALSIPREEKNDAAPVIEIKEEDSMVVLLLLLLLCCC